MICKPFFILKLLQFVIQINYFVAQTLILLFVRYYGVSTFEMNTQIYFKLWFTYHDDKMRMININQNDSYQKLSKHVLVYKVLVGLRTALKTKHLFASCYSRVFHTLWE